MAGAQQYEVWQRGPIQDIPPLLQPVAHALLQAREETNELLINFPEALLWLKPEGSASVAFHLMHMVGVLDRLFSYARGLELNEAQLTYLAKEGVPDESLNVEELIQAFNTRIDISLYELSNTDETTLTEYRGVGRKKLPSTVIGLLVHSAEHTMRHMGQLLVTAKWLKAVHGL
ncbi:MAG: DinB family protein [Chitinophagaceae bacterium]|nr:DinB family protein [Chitinophagaceae bacterium]